ncbi:SDR family NAD(P)-dependent oxidoreductase [Parasphingorhabdus sp.]|uniref:SDR family NAD(P)-dependent oxidoreductase n=1 Tax=Parasphingorhabdus sp. TaxID=2709688 RepID=UPI001B56E804|nr:SDR family NAD(P)-dependent oxidoreductase [Parasphingorhabdus sp.]MBQ0772246.1 SDR family NAD(P)-dependent oxidoreductase [Sphingomonadales bacterium]|tara:strand:+ start:4432 stop:5301 length:870 start_codon:yes stop_codon:yes gene_type:complete
MGYYSGKIAVITGGASGVGKCLCHDLAQAGADVVIVDINAERIEAVRQELSVLGTGKVLGFACDVTKEISVRETADKIFAEFETVHFLFNNAGVGLGEAQRKIWDLPISDWRWGFDVNVLGVVHGIAAFVPRMLEAGQDGMVINSSSANGGLYSMPNTPIYAATKAAVTSISEVLHQQLVREGGKIKAGVLFPGPHTVNTGILASGEVRPDDYVDNEAQKKVAYRTMDDLLAATGLKLQLTEPEEVSEFALQCVTEGRFWMIPENEDGDRTINARYEQIIARENPPSGW